MEKGDRVSLKITVSPSVGNLINRSKVLTFLLVFSLRCFEVQQSLEISAQLVFSIEIGRCSQASCRSRSYKEYQYRFASDNTSNRTYLTPSRIELFSTRRCRRVTADGR